MLVNEDKINDVKKYTTFAGHFDGRGNATVRWGVHCLMEQIHGYTRCHWMLPLGKYLHRIPPADAMASILDQKFELLHCETAALKLAQSNELCRKDERHDSSRRAQLSF